MSNNPEHLASRILALLKESGHTHLKSILSHFQPHTPDHVMQALHSLLEQRLVEIELIQPESQKSSRQLIVRLTDNASDSRKSPKP